MRRLVLALILVIPVVALQITYGQGQSQDPFFDHGDRGELIHVLPTPAAVHTPHDQQQTYAPPSDETSVFPASYGSGNLTDHGGLEIAGAAFQPVFYNTSVANSTDTSLGYARIQDQIHAFASAFSDSTNWDNSTTDDYTIVQQYGSHAVIASSLTSLAVFVDGQSTPSSISDSSIRSYLTSLFNTGRLGANASTIYGVYFPPGTRVRLQGGASCTSFCGYHSHFSYGGIQVKYAVFPYLNCSGCSLSGRSVADMLTMVTSHEIREAVTDPGDSNVNAWYDAKGYEADDKCAWHNLYQMTNGSFWVQPEYSNGGTVTRSGFTATYPGPGCIVPR